MKTRRELAISNIEDLYPADSKHMGTRLMGQSILNQAQKNCSFTWRSLPIQLLLEYERLCTERDKELFRKHREKVMKVIPKKERHNSLTEV